MIKTKTSKIKKPEDSKTRYQKLLQLRELEEELKDIRGRVWALRRELELD